MLLCICPECNKDIAGEKKKLTDNATNLRTEIGVECELRFINEIRIVFYMLKGGDGANFFGQLLCVLCAFFLAPEVCNFLSLIFRVCFCVKHCN